MTQPDNTFDTIGANLAKEPPQTVAQNTHRLKGKIYDLTASPVVGTDILEELRAVCLEIDAAVAGTAVVGTVEVGGDVATAVGSVVGGTTFIVALVIAALIVAVLLFIENILYYVVLQIPFGMGKGLQGWVRTHFQWVQDLEAKIAEQIASAVAFSVHQWFNLIKAVLIFEGVIPESGTNTVIYKPDKHVNTEIAQLQAQVKYLLAHVGTVEYVTTDKTIKVAVPQNVWDDIHQLQDDIRTMRQDITSLQDSIDRLTHSTTSNATQIHNIETSVHEVRAISVGWADIQTALDQLTTRVTHIQTTYDERLDNQGRTLTAMQPLTILQGAGLRGLKTLRQLEDTPCMCPKLPGIPNEAGTALAIYEFVTNG